MQIGSYQVLFELGRGGMGTVNLGRVRGTGDFERLVAIKRQREHDQGFNEPPERFLAEARLAGLVHHANVVGIHQAGVDAEGYYFVCDYVEGLSLATLVSRKQEHPLWPVPIVTRLMLDALAGLQAVHEAVDSDGRALGMLHRDLALDNLLVGRDGVTRLADFGIAKTTSSTLLTEVGQIRGKLPYLAPEYLGGEVLDKTFDIYAAGISLWVALTGELPWRDRSEVHVMQAIVTEGVPPVAREGRPCPPALEAVIARACHRNSRARFQSAREMLDALESAVASSGTIANHVQVAEYVESVAGQDLAARRARIQARRRELDGELTKDTAADRATVRMRSVVIDASSAAAPGSNATALARRATLRAPSFTPPTGTMSAARCTPPAPQFTPPTGPRFMPPASFTPPAPRVAAPARQVAAPAPQFTPPAPRFTPPRAPPRALSFTPPAPHPSASSRRITPRASHVTPSGLRFTALTTAGASASATNPVRLPLSPALPRIAFITALLLLLLTTLVLVRPSKLPVAPATSASSVPSTRAR